MTTTTADMSQAPHSPGGPPPAGPYRIHPKAIRARRNRRLLIVAGLVLIATVGYLMYWYTHDRFWIRTDNAYVTGNLVPVAAQASGIITQVLAEETQFVNRGDLLVRLDEHQAYAALGRARGRLGEEVRRIAALFINRKQLAEKLRSRTARLELAEHDMDRYQRASPSGAISKQILQNTADKIASLEAEVRETQAELDSLDAQIGGTTVMAHPSVDLAKHQLIEAHLEYARQQIRAPISGYVAKRKAQVGDRVQPGASLMTIVPLDHLWVEANLRETELQHVRPGQSALVSVSLYGSKQTFHGTVEGLVPGSGSAFALLPPDNSTGNFIHIVERVPVRIALPADELREHPIRPGLSTMTSINITESGQSVWTSLATPSTAEYETDVYADELPTAESMAKEVMATNLVVNEQGGGLDSLLEEEEAIERVSPRKNTERAPSDGRVFPKLERPREREDRRPSSFVPRRSPDLGATTFPLTPSIGPDSGSLGPEAGRSPSRLKSGFGMDEGRRTRGTVRP
ncbi:MAG: Putative Multidrug resistance protein A (Modular protein) [Nitrospira sp.]|nr:MAG: Putative Multidrug resistance protein A (Modular protein) [Nitrospira sp.]